MPRGRARATLHEVVANLHLVDRDSMCLTRLHCPGDIDCIGGVGAKLTQGCDIHREGWSLGLRSRIGRHRVREGASLLFTLTQAVQLVVGGNKQGKSHQLQLLSFSILPPFQEAQNAPFSPKPSSCHQIPQASH